MYEATGRLGIQRDHVRVLDFPVCYFEEKRQEILEAMVKINKEIDPDVVFSTSIHDVHQDHVTIANECMGAFKRNTILQYEAPWNNYSFDNQMFIGLDEVDVETKIKAVKCYRSQAQRDYTSEEFIRSLLVTHGVQIGKKYAGVYEVPHMIVGDYQ